MKDKKKAMTAVTEKAGDNQKNNLLNSENSVIINKIREAVCRIYRGNREAVDMILAGVICQGHILLNDVPGVGKTTLFKALAAACGCSYKRIQFTPDLMPADITGIYIYDRKSGDFQFRPGPLFAQFILADEINRASPKTQSSMLEAMEEKGVTVEGKTWELPSPFIVMATQNPIEYEGTFPLPEAQLDRFLISASLDYPDFSVEMEIMNDAYEISEELINMKPAVTYPELEVLHQGLKSITIEKSISEYIVSLVVGTRSIKELELGASPRGTVFLARASRARALMAGRNFVLPDDVKYMASAVLAHRLVLTPHARFNNISGDDIIRQVMEKTPVPL